MSEDNAALEHKRDDDQARIQEVNVGHELRRTREAQGITVDEVSAALKLSPSQVEALEENDWSHLPKTIIRGFVRNYARYLRLDAAPLMAALDRMPLPKGPELAVKVGAPVSMPKEGRADRRDYVRVVAGGIALLLAVLVYFFVPAETWHSTLQTLKELVESAKPSSGSIPQQAVEPVAETAAEARSEVAAPVPVAVPEAAPGPAPTTTSVIPPAEPAPPVSGSSVLHFSFAKPSWVEVRDSSGQVIFSQLSQAGSQREVVGRPPFSLVIGSASSVALQYNGKAVDLSKRSKDDVARLTVE